MGTRVRVRPIPWSSPDAYPSGGNPSLSYRWAKWHSRLMAPIESRTPDWRMGFGLQTARTGLRYRNPVIERTAISRVSKSFRGDLQPGKVAMPRGPRSEKRPADVIGAGRYLPWPNKNHKMRHYPKAKKRPPAEAGLMHVSSFSSPTGTTQWSRQQGNASRSARAIAGFLSAAPPPTHPLCRGSTQVATVVSSARKV